MRRCSVTHRLDKTEKIAGEKVSESGVVLVLVEGARDWTRVIDTRVLDLIATRYGNVSVFTENNSSYVSEKVLKYCRRMGDKCVRLDNLLPVLDQLNKWNSQQEVSSTFFDIYDTRWFPITMPPPLPVNQSFSVHRQIKQLVASLCVRDKRYNHYFELHHTSESIQQLCVAHFIILAVIIV